MKCFLIQKFIPQKTNSVMDKTRLVEKIEEDYKN